jgi:hypothetical protein
MHPLAALFVLASNGQGLVGETDDKMVTAAALGLVLFFALTVTLLSLLQGHLERRKDQRKAAELRRRVGW